MSNFKLLAVAKAAAEKKATDIIFIDMRKLPSIVDYFVIASGSSAPQLSAISRNIIERLRYLGRRPSHIEEDLGKSRWLLLDYGDVVVHIFHEDARKFYNLERLWGDAPQRRFRPQAKRRVVDAKRKKARKKR